MYDFFLGVSDPSNPGCLSGLRISIICFQFWLMKALQYMDDFGIFRKAEYTFGS